MKKPLSPKQRLFVHEYLVSLNAAEAARRAGYSVRRAKETGCRLMKLPAIKRAIEEARKKRETNLIMTREEILRELSIIGRADLKDFFVIQEGGEISAKPFDEMPEGTSRALESIEEVRTIRESSDGSETNVLTDRIKFKTHSKLGALELLGRHEGLFPNKVEGKLELEVRHSMSELKKSMKEAADGSGS